MQARDLMNKPVTAIRPDANVGEAAWLMLEANTGCLPVVDEQEHLVGILTLTDFGLHPRASQLVDNLYSLFGTSTSPKHIEDVSQKVASKLVKDVMRHPVTTVKEDTPIGEVVELMLSRGIHRVPVMRGEHIVGIVTHHDFLKLIAPNQ